MNLARGAEWCVVLAAAAALHMLAFLQFPAESGGDAGDNGQNSLSVQPMTVGIAGMIASVDLADEVTEPARVVPAAAAAVTPSPQEPLAPPTDASPEATVAKPAMSVSEPSAKMDAFETERSTSPDAGQVPAFELAAEALPLSSPLPDQVSLAVPVAQSAVPASQAQITTSANSGALVSQPISRQSEPEPAPAAPPSPVPAPNVLAALPGTEAQSDLAPEVSRRPASRPDRPEATQTPNPPAPQQEARRNRAQAAPAAQPVAPRRAEGGGARSQPQQRAAGSDGGAQAGSSNSAAPSLSQTQRTRLMARWGSQIRSRIERRKPRGVQGRGRVTLGLVVTVQGRVVGLSVVSSSGNSAIDNAAVRAAQRAGRMPRAPRGLGGSQHAFQVSLQFN